MLEVVTTTLSKALRVFKLIGNSSLHARAGILISLSSSLYCKNEHCNFFLFQKEVYASQFSVQQALRDGQLITEEQTGGRPQLSSGRSRSPSKIQPRKFYFIYYIPLSSVGTLQVKPETCLYSHHSITYKH